MTSDAVTGHGSRRTWHRPTPGPIRVWFREITYFRRIWKANVLAAFVQPILYLLGVGVGIGVLVDEGPTSAEALGGVSYFAFYATALLATTAMFTASSEALWPTMDGFMWSHAYSAMVATPIEPGEVATGLAIHHATRTMIGATGVAVVLAVFPDTRSWGLIPAVGAAMLCGMAFALPLAAWTATRTSDISFPTIMRFGIVPMFLFAGAFFPISELPEWLQKFAWVTPLWHGIELCRGLVLGGLGATEAIAHLAVLLVFVVGGWVACQVTFRRRLRP